MKTAPSVSAYIQSCEPDQRLALQQIRAIVLALVPEAEELISYGMPAFKYHGLLLWYAAQREHYGLYPKAAPIAHFAAELKNYDCSKGTIRFPRHKSLPVALIKKIVKYCVILNTGKSQQKKLATDTTSLTKSVRPKKAVSLGSNNDTLKKTKATVAKKKARL